MSNYLESRTIQISKIIAKRVIPAPPPQITEQEIDRSIAESRIYLKEKGISLESFEAITLKHDEIVAKIGSYLQDLQLYRSNHLKAQRDLLYEIEHLQSNPNISAKLKRIAFCAEIDKAARGIVVRNRDICFAVPNHRVDVNFEQFDNILKRRNGCLLDRSAADMEADNITFSSFLKKYSKCHMSEHCCVRSECRDRGLAGLVLYPKDPKHAVILVEVCQQVYGSFMKSDYTHHQAALKWYLTKYPGKTFEDLTGYSVKGNTVKFNSMSFNMARDAFEVEKELVIATRDPAASFSMKKLLDQNTFIEQHVL